MKKIKTTYFLVFDRRKNLRIRKRPTYMDDGEFTIKLDIIVADKFSSMRVSRSKRRTCPN